MNIRRYMAPDMRTAFKLVREELGPDVVILSTRRIKGQIELTVASDQSPPSPQSTLAVKEVSFPGLKPRMPIDAPASPSIAAFPAIPASPPTITPTETIPMPVTAVDDELRALRRLLETQLAALAWNDVSRRTPAVAAIMRELTDFGFSREFATSALDHIPEGAELGAARQRAYAAVESRILTTGDVWSERGGTIVMVGPAGAGKTTALAALAARWVMHHGTQGAALISAGESRFGVHENLARVGRLVGLPVHTLSAVAELPALLARLGDRRFVLIDTAGYGPRSPQFESHLRALKETLPHAQFALALSASSQPTILREVIAGYRSLNQLACILSHVDECDALGGALSALIDNDIPVAYTLTGPRLLDDLRPARADSLMTMCVRSGASTTELMREEQTHVA